MPAVRPGPSIDPVKNSASTPGHDAVHSAANSADAAADAHLSDVPAAAAVSAQGAEAANGHGTHGVDGADGIVARAADAALRAVRGFLAETPGKHGDKAAAAARLAPGVPLEALGLGAVEMPGVDGDFPGADPVDGSEIEDELAQAFSEEAVNTAEDTVMMGMEAFALWQLRSAARAADCAEKMRIKGERRERIIRQLMKWGRKNPEKAAKFLGLLTVWSPGVQGVIWVKQFVAVQQEGQRLRAATAPASANLKSEISDLKSAPAPSPAPTVAAETAEDFQ